MEFVKYEIDMKLKNQDVEEGLCTWHHALYLAYALGWALFCFFENFENCSSPTLRYVFRDAKNRFEKNFGQNTKICRPVKDLLSEFTFGM